MFKMTNDELIKKELLKTALAKDKSISKHQFSTNYRAQSPQSLDNQTVISSNYSS